MTPGDALKRKLAVLASIEQGGGDISGMRPDEMELPEDFDVAAPVSGAQRMPIVPKVVDVDVSPRPDEELLAAESLDEEAMRQRLFETATRQLIGGLTRTPVQASLTQQTQKKPELLAQRAKARMDALRELEAGNNAKRTEAYLGAQDKQSELANKRLALDESEAKAREARNAAAQLFDREKFDESKRHHKASEGAQWMSAKRADDKATRDDERLRPRQGWEPIEPGAPTFRDAAQAKAFDTSVSAMGAIRNHRDHVLHELEALKKAKTPGEADIIVGRLNAQMGALASKLRDAEGLNNTDAANHAIETMLSLQNGSAVNWKNVVNQGRLPAILDAAINSGEANLDTIAQSNNLRRARGTRPQQHEESAAKTTPSGKPYARKQYSQSQNKTRFLDESGAVVEVIDGR